MRRLSGKGTPAAPSEQKEPDISSYCGVSGLCPANHLYIQPASFTVEAALLMTILLPVIICLLYLGFYLHDRGVLQGTACEITASADNHQWKNQNSSKLPRQGKAAAKKRILSVRGLSGEVRISKDDVTATFTGSISLPGLIPQLIGKKKLHISESQSRRLLRPSDVIRVIRGLEALADLRS